jgi:RsiW-degrading membrane proteinase PrsW (M82 family)
MDLTELALLFTLAFLPPIIYAIWIRNTERYEREKWKPIFLCFLWGATIAIAASLILEVILDISLSVSVDDKNILSLVAVIIVAPFAEEFTKPLVLRLKTVKRGLDELEDGLIYGAVAGLGFSATENLLYGYSFLSKSLLIFFILMTIRSVGGCLLHASATSLTGYGYGKSIMKKTSFLRVLPFFILAILVHGLYNFFVSFDMIGLTTGLFVALVFVIMTIYFIRIKIRTLDRQTS